jgi:hypothetical protein
MDARRFDDTRGLANITLKEPIKKKTAALRTWQRDHGAQARLRYLGTRRAF